MKVKSEKRAAGCNSIMSLKIIQRSLLQAFGWSMHSIQSFCFWMKVLISNLMDSNENQDQPTTNEECHETSVQAVTSMVQQQGPGDTVDSGVNESVVQALEGVSAAIYQICFSKWHCPPEEMKQQPLFKEINAAIRGIYSNMKTKARPLEEYEILIAVLNALIAHLKDFRKKRVTYRYKTTQEEVDFLRKHTKRLLLYWLPDSLRNSDHIVVFLNEILSINVLRPSINNLADDKFINETIVKTLASEQVRKMDVPETLNTNKEEVPFSSHPAALASDSNEVYKSDGGKSRKNMKKGFKSLFKGIHKKSKRHVAYYSMSNYEDTMESMDGSIETDQQFISDDESDDKLVSSSCDTFLENWLQEKWTATISESPTQDRPTYKISLSKEDNSNTKLWTTERGVKDFRLIYDIIQRQYQDVFTTSKKIEEIEIDEDNQFFQVIKMDPNTFIDKLLELVKLYQNPEPIFFFSPLNYDEEGREIFSKVFSNDHLEKEDYSAAESETEVKTDESDEDTNECYENDGFRMLLWKRKSKNKKYGSGSQIEDVCDPNPSSSENHTSPMLWDEEDNAEETRNTAESSTSPFSALTDEPSVKMRNQAPRDKNDAQRQKLEAEFLAALYDLADELVAGGRHILRFLYNFGRLNESSKEILAVIPNLYTEEKIVWYLNQTSELLLADVYNLDVPPHKLPLMAQELLKSKLKSKLKSLQINKLIRYFCEDTALNNISASHEAFQNSRANKETLFRIFEDLTRIIINGSQEARTY